VEKPSLVASVLAGRGILHLPQVSFLGIERRKKSCLHATGFLIFAHLCFAGFISGRHERIGVTDGVVLGMGGGDHCGAGVCSWGC
jgi:hypothetical protein